MFDFLRNLTKSAEEKRQEAVAAYLDGALNDRERQRLEQEMAQDAALRAHIEQLLLIKQSLRRLPQREVPRNFMLDPAAYGRPARQPWVQAYPVLRTATALAAFFFIFAIAAGIFATTTSGGQTAMAPAADVAQDVAQIETTRVVTEIVTEATESLAFEADSAAEEEMAEAAPAAEAAPMVETFEEPMEEAETAEDTAESEAPTAEAVEAEAAPPEEPVAVPQATAPAPTPTVSDSPRVASPTPLPDRDTEEMQTTDDTANGAVADMPELAVADETAAVETTAVLPEEDVQNVTVDEPVNWLLWLQVGLGALLLLLVGLTFYARRQR